MCSWNLFKNHTVILFVFSFLYYLLGLPWLVKHFVAPAIKAEWISYRNMYVYAGNNKKGIYPSFLLHPLYMFAKHAQIINEVWDLDVYVLIFLMDWYIKPVDFGFVDMGRRE